MGACCDGDYKERENTLEFAPETWKPTDLDESVLSVNRSRRSNPLKLASFVTQDINIVTETEREDSCVGSSQSFNKKP